MAVVTVRTAAAESIRIIATLWGEAGGRENRQQFHLRKAATQKRTVLMMIEGRCIEPRSDLLELYQKLLVITYLNCTRTSGERVTDLDSSHQQNLTIIIIVLYHRPQLDSESPKMDDGPSSSRLGSLWAYLLGT